MIREIRKDVREKIERMGTEKLIQHLFYQSSKCNSELEKAEALLPYLSKEQVRRSIYEGYGPVLTLLRKRITLFHR